MTITGTIYCCINFKKYWVICLCFEYFLSNMFYWTTIYGKGIVYLIKIVKKTPFKIFQLNL